MKPYFRQWQTALASTMAAAPLKVNVLAHALRLILTIVDMTIILLMPWVDRQLYRMGA